MLILNEGLELSTIHLVINKSVEVSVSTKTPGLDLENPAHGWLHQLLISIASYHIRVAAESII